MYLFNLPRISKTSFFKHHEPACNGLIINFTQVFTRNTSDWASGSYFYTLCDANQLLKTGKIEIIH